MIRLEEDNGKIKEKFPDGEKCYKFIENEKMIGLASINKDDEDKIYIFIKEELRGNGYGKKLFSEIIKELEKKEYKEINVKCETSNIQIKKIIIANGGIHLSTTKGIEKYIIPILSNSKK